MQGIALIFYRKKYNIKNCNLLLSTSSFEAAKQKKQQITHYSHYYNRIHIAPIDIVQHETHSLIGRKGEGRPDGAIVEVNCVTNYIFGSNWKDLLCCHGRSCELLPDKTKEAKDDEWMKNTMEIE